MALDWTKLKKGFKEFEKLAVEFVKETEKEQGFCWEKTKDSRDKNHDAIAVKELNSPKSIDVAIFVGYSTGVDIWWMEAKYSALKETDEKFLSRYRLDATIVSAVLSKNISKVVFVTNTNIASKTIWDIRRALIFSNSCKEVNFYTRNHLESWLLNKDFNWFKTKFDYTENEFYKLRTPPFNCIEELSFYNIGDNLFHEPLNTLYGSFIYEICFSIFVQQNFTAKIKQITNLEPISDSLKKLELTCGMNHFSFHIKVPAKLQHESVTNKDRKGEYKDVLPISLGYELEDAFTHHKSELTIIPGTAIRIIDSSYFYQDIPSQNQICCNLEKDTILNSDDPTRNFTLVSLFGKSGVGKTFTLNLYKRKILESGKNIICFSYIFSGNKLEDIKALKKFVFNLFFPFILYEDLDEEYIETLKKINKKLSNLFWKFISSPEDIDSFMAFSVQADLMPQIFPHHISINHRIAIFDDFYKLENQLKEIFYNIITFFIKQQYPIFCIIVSLEEINLANYRKNKSQILYSRELTISQDDIKHLLHNNKILNMNNVSVLFGSFIEVIYFIKYLSQLGKAVSDINDFKLAYHSFKHSEILKNEIISKFKKIFHAQTETETLCSCIYYSSSGIYMESICHLEKSNQIINTLLDAKLIRKNENDYYVAWHDYYIEIYRNNFPLKPYKGIDVSFMSTYDIKNHFDLKCIGAETSKRTLKHLEKLFSMQKFYSIYYILENIFLNEEARLQLKNRVSVEDYYLLFAYFCYANTNAGSIRSGYEMFNELYLESCNSSKPKIQIINYIILFELINSLFENDEYEMAMEKIYVFNNMPLYIKNNWIYLFEWDYNSIKYAVSTIKLLIDSENGINCLNKVPNETELPQKDVAFSTYRLLLCNLTNDFDHAQVYLKKYCQIILNTDIYDSKTKYMYDFTIKFLKCIANFVDISEVINANDKLKNEFLNDYNRHIFAVSILALLKKDIKLCESYRMEYIKTNRPMKKRQQAFQSALLALISLYYQNTVDAIEKLKAEMDIFKNKKTYLPIIQQNIKYVQNFKFCLQNIEFYIGQELCHGKYYIDIRMLY